MKCVGFLFFMALVCLCQTAKLPSSIQVCKRSDPNINECFKAAVQHALPLLKDGVPELNLISVEPIVIPSMTVDAGSASMSVKQRYDNVTIYNVSHSIVDKAEIEISPNQDKFKSSMYITLPYISVDSDYDFDGQILMLPLKGKGKCSVTMENTKLVVKMSGGRVEKKGVAHLKVEESNVEFLPSSAHFHFDNLFNGDEALGNEMNKLINENWKDLYGEVRGAYEETLAALFKNTANTFFSKLSLDELFPA